MLSKFSGKATKLFFFFINSKLGIFSGVGFSMGRPDVHLDRRVAENHQAIPRNNVRSTPSLDLSTLFDETSETKPMDPKTMAAVRAGKENYLRSNNSYISVAPTLVNDRGNTILHLAASSGHVSLVRYIIQKCPGLLLKSNMMGEVALHLAAEAGHLDVVWNLIDFINDISCTNLPVAKRIYFAKNKNQDTALHVALKGKHEVVASYLVSAAKSLSFVANRDGFSPLYLAIEAGHTSLVTTMCHGTNELSSKVGGRSIVHAALKANRKGLLLTSTKHIYTKL